MSYKIIVLSGVSGVGKTTIANILKSDYLFKSSISYTTRSIRSSEINDVHYKFISLPAFLQKIDESFFLEYTQNFGNYYGTAFQDIDSLVLTNNTVMTVCPKGFFATKKKWGQKVIGIYLSPPSSLELHNRMSSRDSSASDEELDLRLQNIYLQAQNDSALFDFVIPPSSIQSTVLQIMKIFNSFK